MLVNYVCSYTDCSLYQIEREGADDGTRRDIECTGVAEDGLRCGRLLDRLGDTIEHVDSERPPIPEPQPEPTAAELAAQKQQALRQQKRSRLQETDWTQLPDVQARLTNAQKTAALNYRVGIRDGTKPEDFPIGPDLAVQ